MPETHAQFDAAITALAKARSIPQRLDALAATVERLYGIPQSTPARKLPRRGDLPLALRWFLTNYRRERRVMGRFNRVLPERHVKPGSGGYSTFLAECAGVYFLGYQPGAIDPIVWGTEAPPDQVDGWEREQVTVSQALAAHVLADYAMCHRTQVFASRATTSSLLTATADLLHIPIGWRTAWSLNLWAGRGVVLAAVGFDPAPIKGDPWRWTISAAANRRADLAFLDPLIPTWDLDYPGGIHLY